MPKPGFKSNRNRRTRKRCYFTENKINYIDFKEYEMLKRFISDRGKILPRRVTGTKAYFQKHLAVAIKRARFMALLPYVKE
jgi:small subunit ribosomal protein S18